MAYGRLDLRPRWFVWGLLRAHPFEIGMMTFPQKLVCRISPFVLVLLPTSVQYVLSWYVFRWKKSLWCMADVV